MRASAGRCGGNTDAPREMGRPPTLRLGMVAGEPSGDLLGAGLMAAIERRCPSVRFLGAGGPAMRAAGLDVVVAAEALTMNGIVDPILNLPRLWRLRRRLREAFAAASIDGFVGIDFNGFNLGLERSLKSAGVPVTHYVSPSIYAWRQGRLGRFHLSMDQVLTLYPFESELYRASSVTAVFVGHPLADELAPLAERSRSSEREALRAEFGVGGEDVTVLAVLPGSRSSELRRLLSPFLAAALRLEASRQRVAVLLAAVDAAAADWIRSELLAGGCQRFEVVVGRGRDVLAAADLALIKSGTGTLEAMLLGVPMVVAYRVDPLTAAIVRPMLRTPYVALPNLLAAERLVPEFLQKAVEADSLAQALAEQLPRSAALRDRFSVLSASLRQGASERAAEAVIALLARRGIRIPGAA